MMCISRGADEQRFLGSGFVLAYAGRLYGVTAKHVLLIRKRRDAQSVGA
jgi:hypothetical protein